MILYEYEYEDDITETDNHTPLGPDLYFTLDTLDTLVHFYTGRLAAAKQLQPHAYGHPVSLI